VASSTLKRRWASASALLALALTLSGCDGTGTSSPASTSSQSTVASLNSSSVDRALSSSPDEACANPTTRYEKWCHALTVAGRTFRYLLFRATPTNVNTVIFDPGGPGSSNLSRMSMGFEDVAAKAQPLGYNVLVVDEPWVVAAYEPTCRTALSSFYADSLTRYPQGASESALGAVRAGCLADNAPALSTPAIYRSAVDEIERREKVRVTRLEGYSFASVRAAYLGASRPELVVAVGTPFPVGANALDFYRAASSGGSSPTRATQTLMTDSALAYYEATGASPSDVDLPTAARALWQVATDGGMSLSRVGYYSEMCYALKSWRQLSDAVIKENNPRLAAHASVHSICASLGDNDRLALPAKSCFAVLKDDRGTPWVSSPVTRAATVERLSSGEHGKVAIPACR
jgi:hypothetical protein